MLDFLTLKPEAFSLAVSDQSLRVVKLKKKGGVLSLASFAEIKIEPGIIEAGEIKNHDHLAEIIKEALREVKGERLKTNYVMASLPEEKAFLRVIQMPKMKEQELKKAVYFEAENYIPLSLEKVYLDSQIIPRFNKDSSKAEVLIAAMPKEIVDNYLAVFRKAGLKPIAFEVEAQSMSRALIKKGKENCSVLLIDLGDTRTGLVFFSRGSLRFTATLPAVSEEFSREQLVREIKKHIDYYKSHETEPASESLLCGSGASSKELPDFLSGELGIKTSVANPWVNILPDPPKEIPELSFEDSLRYSTALGLALYDKFTSPAI